MARRRVKQSDKSVGRDNKFTIARRRLPLSKFADQPLSFLRTFEDRRTFHPEGEFRPLSTFTSRARYEIRPKFSARPSESVKAHSPFAQGNYPSWRVGFVKPQEVLTCVRRNIRRQVLHAFRVAGKSGLGGPRYNQYSKVSC